LNAKATPNRHQTDQGFLFSPTKPPSEQSRTQLKENVPFASSPFPLFLSPQTPSKRHGTIKLLSHTPDKLYSTPAKNDSKQTAHAQREPNVDTLRLKCFHPQTGEVRVIKCRSSPRQPFLLTELLDVVYNEFKLDSMSCKLALQYKDNEGEHVLLRNQEDLIHAIESVRKATQQSQGEPGLIWYI
jgi:hypothetical protein